MTTPRIEEMVAKYTRVIHPQDLGEETNKLENTLRQALTAAHQAWIEGAVEIVNRHGKQCDKNYHAECIEMIKEALQDNKADHLPDRPLNYERE